MITVAAGPTYHVTADEPQLLAERLEVAEKLARERALRDGNHGVLVTRHGLTSFTVDLSPDVPYGTSQERDLA
jgi:hypothetical protein